MRNADLIKAIRAHKGKVSIPMLIPSDVVYIIAEKKDLIAWLSVEPEAEQLQIIGTFNDVLQLDAI